MSSSISLAPHLQRALDAMSKDMAVDSQALVNQAVFAWLRINGYVLPGAVVEAKPVVVVPVQSTPTPVPMIAPVVAPLATALAPVIAPPAPALPGLDLGPALLRMAEIDADLEKLTRAWPDWSPVQQEEEEEAQQEEEQDEASAEEDEQEAEEPESEPEPEEEVAAPAEEDSDDPGLDANTGETDIEEPSESTIVLRSVPINLYLEREGEEPIRVTAERFIIGRGAHCDLVIDSPRVSREHVALTRKGVLFYIEDLNSSNGTWFGEERVTTRELESGDVINLGNEPVTFFLRAQ